MNIPEFARVVGAVIHHNIAVARDGGAPRDYLVPMAWGDPGLGKTEIIESVTGELGDLGRDLLPAKDDDHGWQVDPEAIRLAITPATRAILLVHPNNPTGHFTKWWEAQGLERLCWENDLALIVDEVFLDYGLAGRERSFAAGLENADVYIVSGLSKIAGLPQMKAGWIVATGPNCGPALQRLEVIADTFLSMNAPVQYALPAWLAGREAIQEQIRERVEVNLAELDHELKIVPAVARLEREGGWYAILRIPALQPDEQTVLELLELGVWVHPGYFFGMAESGWLVLSLLGPVPEFSTGVKKLVNYLQTNQAGNNVELSM